MSIKSIFDKNSWKSFLNYNYNLSKNSTVLNNFSPSESFKSSRDKSTNTPELEEEQHIEKSLVEDETQRSNIGFNKVHYSNQVENDDFKQQTLKLQDMPRNKCWYYSANKIDRSAIVLSPILFSVVNFIYWISYMSRYIKG